VDKARIFISYAREDEIAVRQLYSKLSDAGFDPWMDKFDLLPGEQWRQSIEKALRKADFLIICLSNTSVQKRGFVRREFRAALDLWQEKHDDDIYIIPVRLETCDLPDELGRFQWLDLFENDEWPRLIRALQEGMRRRGKTPHVEPIIESVAPQHTLEKITHAPIADTPPVGNNSPDVTSSLASQPQPEPRKPPSDDPSKAVKLIERDRAPQPKNSRSAVADPKPRGRITWSDARALASPKVKLAGLGLALFIIVLFTWLLWHYGKPTNGKVDVPSPPSPSPMPSGTAPPPRAEAMRYWLKLEKDAGKRVTGLDPLPAGERFQLHFAPAASGYLYLIAPDETRALTAFVTKQRIEAGADFRVPDGDNWINVGEGARFTVIFSQELLKELPFLNGDPRQLTTKEQGALLDFQTRLAGASPETKPSDNNAVVTARKRSDEPLVFEISVSRKAK